MAGSWRLAAGLAVLLAAGQPAAAEAIEAEAINPSALYPEGPVWIDGRLYYAEMTADRISRWDGRANQTVWRSDGCGPTSLASLGADRLLVLCHLSAQLVVLDHQAKLLEVIERDRAGRRLASPNDVIADGRGGAYLTDAGVFSRQAPSTGRVYHLSAEGALRSVAAGLRYANGLVLDRAGGRLFVSEHLGRKVWIFKVLADGSLGAGEPYFDLESVAAEPRFRDQHAGPDGLELDRGGNLYICEYGAGRVLLVDAQGQLREIVQVPLPYLTNIALVPDERAFFVTAAETNRTQPYPGAVYRLKNPLK